MAEGGLKFAQPLAPAGGAADPLTVDLPPDIQAELDAVDVRLRHMRERQELQDRLLSEMDREIAKYEPDPGDEFMRTGLRRERAEMDVARNDPGLTSEMGADPGYGFTRHALRSERAGLTAARAEPPEEPDRGFSLSPSAHAAVRTATDTPTLSSARRRSAVGAPGGRPKRNPKPGIRTRKQGAGLRAAGMQVLDLAEIRRQRLGAGPEDWEEIDRRLNWYRKPKGEKSAGDGERGILEEFTGAFSHSVAESNPEMYGAALEAAGLLAGSQDMEGWGKDLQEWAKGLDIGEPPSVPSIDDIDSFESGIRYILGGLGSGIGSTMPSIVGGAGGALAGSAIAPGPGTVVGAVAGAMLPAAPLNMGEAYLQFVDEGLPKETAAEYAAYITPALTALDAAGLLKAVGGALTRDARHTMLKHVARAAARGFAAEGITEGLQSALREGTAAALTGNPDAKKRAMRVLNEATIGALTGGAIGTGAGAAARRQGAKLPSEEEVEREADALPAEQPDVEAEALPKVQEAEIEEAANEAATSPTNDLPEPTEAQKKAGNYKVGKIKLQGLDISIENPKGSVRKGKDKDGEEWSVTMPAHYGYVRRTEGADGDQVDIYLSDRPAESDPVFVVDQVDADTGAFDEHKVFIGFPTQEQVENIYDAAFDDGKGPQRRKAVRSMPMDEFKTWLREGDTTKPAAEAPQAAPDKPVTVKPAETPEPGASIRPAPVAPQAPSDEEPQAGLFPPAPEEGVSRETQGEPDLSRDTFSFTPEQLQVDPKRFQFKSGSDIEGQTARLQGVTEWNPDAGGRLMVWQDLQGNYWVIDGHQRSGLARRLKRENPDADIRLNASLLREADGVTAEEARTTAAMRNIMEGNASAIDAAKVFRDQPALLESKELPISQDLVRQAQSLARLGDEAFGMAINEVIPANYAAAVGKLVPLEKGQPNDPLQQAVMQIVAEANPPNIVEAESIIRDVVAEGSTREVQETLFGDLELEIPLYRSRAQVLAWSKRKTAFLKRVFGNLVKNEKLIAGQGNVLDTALNEQKADVNARIGLIIDALATRKGPVSDALSAAARGILEEGRSIASVGPEFLQAVEEAGRAGNLLGEADGGPSAVAGLAPAPDLFDAAAKQAPAEKPAEQAREKAPQEEEFHFSQREAKNAPRKPIGKAGVEAAIAPIVDSWKNKSAPKVEVLETAADLPQVAKDHLARSPGAGSIDGLFDVGADTVYLIGDQIRNAEQARRVLAHEAIGHYSMMQMLGPGFRDVLRDVDRLVKRKAPAVKRLADEVRRDYGDQVSDGEVASEVIAKMAENGVRHPVMKKIVAQVRRFLRGLGFRLSFNLAEIEDMISRASNRLKKPAVAGQETPETGQQTSVPDTGGRQRGPDPNRTEQAPATPDVAQAQERFFKSIRQQHQKRRFYPVDRMFRLMMYPVGGINERGEWKYAPAIQKAGRKIIREAKPNPDGAFGWMGPFIEYARAGWLNRYGTPEDFITRERMAASDKYRIEMEGLAFVEALGKDVVTQEEAEALQAILEGKPLNDARLQALAGPIRESLDKYGRELVDLGLLAEETYLENLGEWLHRSYRKYEQDQPPLVRWAQKRGKKRRQALVGDELKVRGKIHKAPPVDRLLKDVPADLKADAKKAKAWRIFDRVSQEGGKVVQRVYWPDGVKVPQGEVWDRGGSWQDRGKWDMLIAKGRKPLLRQDYTEEERAEMGEIRDARFNILKSYRLLAHDIAQGRLFKDIAEHPEWFSKTKPEDVIVEAAEAGSVSPYLGIGWVQVPDTLIPKSNQKRWGVLSGGWIRACIWRDMVELNKMQNPGTWHWLLRQYKQNKTSRSFGVHFNNTMSNVFLADMHDLTAGDLTAAIMEYINKGKLYQEAVEHGIFSGGYARNELQHNEASRALRKALKLSEAKANPQTNFQALWNIVASADNALRGAYQWEDEIFRLTTYMRDRQQGDEPTMAARNAIDRFLNYDIRAPWPNALRRSVLPFFSYTYASVPQIMKATVARPWKLAKLFTLGYLLNELSYELTGGDEERERAVMADRDQGYTWLGLPRLLRMPFRGPHEDPLYMDLSRVIPGGGMLETDMGQAGLPEFLLVGGPLSMAADVLWNRVAFSGEDIVNRDIDTGVEAAEKRMAYLWRAAMPNLPFVPGSWSWKMLNQAISDERDIFGRQYDIPLAAIRSFGPKMKPQDPEYQYLMRQFDFRRERKELKRRMYQISSDRNRRRIGKARFDRELKDFQERMNELAEREAELHRKFKGRREKK